MYNTRLYMMNGLCMMLSTSMCSVLAAQCLEGKRRARTVDQRTQIGVHLGHLGGGKGHRTRVPVP